MARNSDVGRKTDLPDSDESARNKHALEQEDENYSEVTDVVTELQTSNKTGKHSTSEKLAASRPEFGTGRGAQPVDGAFGKDDSDDEDGHGPLRTHGA
jgi:hypothetical protein